MNIIYQLTEKYTPIKPAIIKTHSTNKTFFRLKSITLDNNYPVTVPNDIISSPRTYN